MIHPFPRPSWSSSLTILLILLLSSTLLRAQTTSPAPTPSTPVTRTGQLTGVVLNATTAQPVEFANVGLLDPSTGKVISGGGCDEHGHFLLSNLPFGTYQLKVSFVGFESKTVDAIVLSEQQPTVSLAPLRLAPGAAHLGEVTVTGEVAVVQDQLDKRVINVEKDLSSVGGTAVNVLQNVPSVTVDQNGQVSLRGTPNITIYIDGKLSSAGRAGLEQIPASQIASVEVMTNPSARYDAQGAGGVINIVLKKQQKPGLNGRAAVNLGTRGKYNTSLSLNRRQGKANFFLAYDWRHDEIQVKHRRDQRISSGNEVIRNRQLTSYGQTAENHAPRVGLDYDFTPTQSLTLSVQPRLNSYQALGRLDTDISNETSGQDLGPLSGPTATRTRSRTVEVLLDYRRTWAEQKGRELSANLVLTPVGWGRSFMEQRYNEGQPGQLVRQQRGYFNFIMGTTQLDYVHPLSPQTRLEAGVKAVLFDTDEGNDFAALPFDGREFVPAPALTRSFRYREQVQAGYGIWRTEVGKLTAQAGLRAEQTNTRGRLTAGQPELNGQEFVRSYFNLFPSATIAYALPAEQRLQLSYSRRINRPSIDAQLPFVEYDNPLSTRVGNPTLLPELSNVLELGHQWQKGAASLGTTAFFRETNQRIQLLRRVLDTTTTVNGQRLPVSNTTFANIGRSTTYGLEVSFNHTLAKWWRLSANTSAFRSLISGDESREIANQAFVYTARLNTTFTPVPKLDVQLTGTYRSPSVSNQGRIAEQYFLDLALKKDVLKDRGSITLRVSDIFDTNQTGVVLTAPDVSMDILLKRESRIAFLGFSYRFGQQDQAPRRPRRNADSSSGGGTDVGG